MITISVKPWQALVRMLFAAFCFVSFFVSSSQSAFATPYTETVPNGNGPIPATYPPVGGTMFVLIGANGNIYYQFVNPSTQFEGYQSTGSPVAFQGSPTFQLGPTQALNCGTVSCTDYFGGSIAEGYVRLTARDGDSCPGEFDYQDLTFNVNGLPVSDFSDLPAGSVERTTFDGVTSIGTENCFRNQTAVETSTAWFDLTTAPGVLDDILTTGSTTPTITDVDPDDNQWFFTDGDDATGSPEVAPGITIEKMADVSTYSVVGDEINYSFLVTNIGSVTLNGIAVVDTFITGSISCPTTTLASGAAMTCTAQHIVTQQNLDDDVVFINTAEVTANPTEGQLGDVSGTVTVTGPAANNTATITKQADSDTDLVLGNVVTYTYVVTNTGNITMDDVSISDVHSGSGTLTPVTPAPVTLAPGASQTFTTTYAITQADIDAGVAITNTATMVATPKRGSFTAPTADESISVLSTDSLAIDKAAPSNADGDASGDVTLGDILTYTITVTNDGTTNQNNVVVSDVILAPSSNTCALVAPGATCVLTGTYTVDQDDVDAGNVVNTAEVVSDEIATPVTDTETTSVEQVQELTIDKPAPSNADEDGSGDVTLNDTLSYTITATNTGTTTQNNVVVSDPLITPNSITCATLAPGATCVLSGDYMVSQTNVDSGTVDNTAGVVSDEITTPVEDSFSQAVAQTDALSIDKPTPANADEDSSGDVSLNDTLTYTITATNTGTTTQNNVIVSDPLITPSTITCAAVGPGATCVLSGDYTVTQTDVDGGSIANTAGVVSDEITTSVEDSHTQTVAQTEELSIDKPAPANADEDGSGDVSLDDTLTYTVTATNSGTTTLTNVIVSDPLITPNTTTCATLAPGATCVLSGDYTVTQTDVDNGSIANTAGVVSDEITTPVEDGNTQPVGQTDELSIDKPAPANADDDSSGDVSLDDTLTYTVTATNSGTTTLSNVIVSDPLITPNTITCATLAPGATCVLSGDYTVTQTDVDTGSIANTAGVISDEITTTVEDSNSQPVAQSDELSIAKPAPANADEDSSGDVSLDDTLTYTVTATNSGTTTLNNVIVSDPLITPNAITCATLAPGATCVLSGDYTVTQTDVDNGSIANTAGVVSDEITTPVEDSFTQPTGQNDSLTIDKPAPTNADEDSSGDVSLDDTLTYTVTATNSGTTTLNNVIVSDPLITPNTVTCATLAPGATCVLSGDYTVTQPDVDNGSIANTAGVVSDEITTPVEDGNTQPVAQTDELSIDKPAPSNADEDGSGDVSLDDTLTYTVTATNSGTTTLNNVIVSDPLISPNSITCATLTPGATCVLTGNYTVTQTDVDTGSIANTAGVISDEITTPVEDGNTQPVGQTDELSINKPAPANADEDSSGDVSLDDTLTYTVTATNSGTTTLTNVIVSDPLITPNTITCATLAPGATCVLSGDYTVTQTDVDGGSIANTAGVVSDEITTPVEDSHTQTVAQTEELSIDKPAPANADEDGSGDVSLDDTLTYTVTATNSGTTTLNNVIVSDPLITPNTITCATLAPSATCVLSGDYTVTQTDVDNGSIANTAGVISDEITTPVEDGNTQPVGQTDELSIDKPAPANADEDSSGDVSLDDTLTYTITATNSGTTTLNNVIVSDPLITPNTITCTTLAPGATCVLSGDYTVTQTNVDDGSIDNTAGVVSDEIATPVEDSFTQPTGQNDGLALDKPAPVNADEDGSGDVSLNDTLTYTITATNTGTTTLNNVVVSDPIITPSTFTCATMAPGATCVLSGDYSVTQIDVDNGSIANTAGVVSDEITTPVEDSFTQPTGQSEALALDKPAPLNADEDSSGDVSLDDTLTYTVTATNSGTTTLTNVIVSDPLITPNTITCATLAPGATCVLSGDYTVTQTDVDNGSIANTAGAVSDEIMTPVDDSYTQPTGQNDGLALDKPAPANADEDGTGNMSMNDTLTYTVTATNIGSTTLNNVIVSDPLITPTTITCATLAPGATCVLSGDYTVTQTDVDNGSITNTAGVVSDEITTPVEDSNSQPVAQSDELSIAKPAPANADEDSSGDFSLDDTLTYTVSATNTGTTTLSNVIVSDPLITPSTIACATLAPGATCVLAGDYTVTQTDVDNGSIANTAGVVSDEITTPVEDSHTQPTDAIDGISVDKPAPVNADEDSSGNVSVNDTLTYTITATNSGTTTLNNVVVSDPLITPNTITCATLAPGATCVLSGDYNVTQTNVDDGRIENTASAISDEITTPVEDSYTQPIWQTYDLTIDKPAPVNADEDSSGDVSLNDTLTYTITATNTGTTTQTNVIVSDALITPSSITCAALAPGATCVLSGDYTVTQIDVDNGLIANTAGVVSDDNTTPVEDNFIQSTGQSDGLAVDKPAPLNADEDSSGDVSLNDTLTYTVTATNTGTTTLNNVAVSDPLITPSSTTCATLAPGATCVLSGNYSVTQTNIDDGSIANTGGAVSDEFPTPVEDSFTQPTGQNDGLALDKPAPANADEDSSGGVSVNDTLTYTVTATNIGSTTLNNVIVSDPLITPNTITCATLAPGATCLLSGDYSVTQADVDNGSIANTAGVVSDEITTPIEDSHTQPVVQTEALVIDKPAPTNADEDGSSDVSLGDTLTYTITATNTGTTTQTNVVISDPLITPSTVTCAALAPGATCVLSGDYTVTQTDVDNGSIANTAGVISDEITTPVDDSNMQPTGQNPGLAVDKPAPINADEDGTGNLTLSDTLTYTVTVTNTGSTTLNNVIVSDPLITPNTTTCTTLAPGAICVLSGTYTVTQTDVDAGSIANTAGVTSNEFPTPIEDSVTENVAQTDGLVIDKPTPANADEDGSGDISVGDTLTYTVTATNTGTTTLNNVIITDAMTTPSSITCATLAPGATCVLSGDYTVIQTDVDNGSIGNTAGVVSDEFPTPVEDSVSEPAAQTDALAINKPAPFNADEDSTGDVSLGDTLTYTVTATNTGTTTLNGVVVTDTMTTPSSMTCATLAPSATCVLSGDYTVTQTDVDNGSIANTANVVSDELTTPVEDSFNQPTGQNDGLSIDKPIPVNADEDGSGDVSRNDTLTYTITAINTGTTSLNNVIITDPLITPSTATCAVLAPGASCVLSGDYQITQTDVDNGSIVNTAGAVSDEITTPVEDSVTQLVSNTEDIIVTKSAPDNADEDGSTDVTLGDTLTYTITATNNGTTTLNNVVVLDLLTTPSTNTCAVVLPSQSCELVGEYVVTQADVDAGSIENTAGAVSDEFMTPIEDTVTEPVAQTNDVTINKAAPNNADEDGTGDVSAGDTLSYTITATNSGTTTLTNVVISDALITPNTQTCAAVAPGATCVLTGTYPVTQTDIDAGTIDNTASVVSDQMPTPVEDSVSQDVNQVDELELEKPAPVNGDEDGSGDITVGDILTYTITATNSGTTTQNNVVISDALTTPATQTCAVLLPGANCVLTGTYTVTQSDIDAGFVNNTASVQSDSVTTPVEDNFNQPLVQIDALDVDKPAPENADEDGSGDVSIGDTLTYTVTATNSGTTTLTNVIVSDALITPNTITCPSLAPNAICVLRGTYVVTQADVDTGNIANSASVVSDEITTPVEDNVDQGVAQTEGLTVNKPAPANNDQDNTGDVSLGDTLTYTVTATNTGSITLNNVVVTDALIVPSSQTCATLAPAATCVLSGIYTVSQVDVDAGNITNTASAVSTEFPNPIEDIVDQTVSQRAGLELNKPAPANDDADGSGDVSLGDTLTYTVTATNTGSTTQSNIIVTDALTTPNSNTCASLTPGATCVLVGNYVVTQADVDAGSIENTASVISDQIATPVNDNFTQDVAQISTLDLDKPAPTNRDEDNTGSVTVGDTLTYTVTATNTGTVTQTNIVVTDPITTPNSISCASLAPGETCVLVGEYVVTLDDETQQSVPNTANVVSSEIQTSVQDSFFQPVLQRGRFEVRKTTSRREVNIGDPIPYQIAVTNTDAQARTGLTYVDIMPTGFSYAPGTARINGVLVEPDINGQRLVFENQTIAGGETATINLVLVTGPSVSEGSFVNQALVESGFNGIALSEADSVAVLVVPSPVFDCSEIIGKVFDDIDRDGVQDRGEDGIPDVRVVTVKGEIITTDEHGRYHIACAQIPNGNIGSNYIVKLDPRSLPTGFRITTENPRVVRLTRGKMTKLNFGATKPRVVTLDLSAQAFVPGSHLMHQTMQPQIGQLLAVLREHPAILRVNYHALPGESDSLTKARLKMVSGHMNEIWETHGCCYGLSVETKMISAGLPGAHTLGGLRR